MRTEWNGWLAEHQADQRAIDPFTAVLDCSGGASESEAAAPDHSGQLGGVEE